MTGRSLSSLTVKELENVKVKAIMEMVETFDRDATYEHQRADRNFIMFIHGSQFTGKQDWQADFTIPKWERSIRAAHANVKNRILNHHDFFDYDLYNKDDVRLSDLMRAVKKGIYYHIDISDFREKISRAILDALIYQTHTYVGWKDILIDNPEFVEYHNRKQRAKERKKLNKDVKNPSPLPATDNPDDNRLMNQIDSAINKIFAEPVNEREQAPDKYLRVGTFDIRVPNPKDVGFDMNADCFSDSNYKHFRVKAHRWQLKELEKRGIFKNVSLMSEGTLHDQVRLDERYIKNRASRKVEDDRDELIYYFGPLIINGRVVQERYSCVIGNNSVMLREGNYPFWEPLGKSTPISSLAAKEVPHKAGGAGAADHGVKLQKHYDAMWQMQYDQALRTMAGLTVVEYNALVDKSILERGVRPGEFVQVRGNPKEKIQYQNLSSNIENQVKPAAEAVRQGIEDSGGLSALTSGGAQLRSRTTKAEVESRTAADNISIDDMSANIANFLAEIIHTCTARFLQFGLDDLLANPDLHSIFEPGEIDLLKSLTVQERMKLINGSFKVRIKGFLGAAQRADAIAKLNELIFMANNPGPLQAMLPMQAILQQWFELQDMGDLGLKLDINNETARVYAENQVLRNNQYISPSPNDKHQVHIQSHMADSSAQTQAMMQHIQEHMMLEQQAQMMQQAPQQQGGQANPLLPQLQALPQ